MSLIIQLPPLQRPMLDHIPDMPTNQEQFAIELNSAVLLQAKISYCIDAKTQLKQRGGLEHAQIRFDINCLEQRRGEIRQAAQQIKQERYQIIQQGLKQTIQKLSELLTTHSLDSSKLDAHQCWQYQCQSRAICQRWLRESAAALKNDAKERFQTEMRLIEEVAHAAITLCKERILSLKQQLQSVSPFSAQKSLENFWYLDSSRVGWDPADANSSSPMSSDCDTNVASNIQHTEPLTQAPDLTQNQNTEEDIFYWNVSDEP